MKKCIFVFILVSIYQTAIGCYCSNSEIEPYQYFSTTYIFEGKVIDIDKCKISFEIIKNYRGDLKNEDAYTFTKCDTYCGIMRNFEVGEVWIMWGSPNKGKEFFTDGCTRSTPKNRVSEHEIEMINKLSKLDGYSEFYSTDSIVIAKGTVKNQNRESLWELFDKNEFRKQISTYRNNKPVSTYIKFHVPPSYSNKPEDHIDKKLNIIPKYVGKIYQIRKYDDFGNTISSKTYNKNEELIGQTTFRDGKKFGHHFAQHYSAHYIDGKLHGKYWLKHYRSDTIQKEGQFRKGEPIGIFNYYDEKGKLILQTKNEDLEINEVMKRLKMNKKTISNK